jgi:hypothetical protein
MLSDEVLGELERFLGKSNFIDIRGKIDEI